jgi:hypothetical protein
MLGSFPAVAGEAKPRDGDAERVATAVAQHDSSKSAKNCHVENPTLAGLFELLALAKAEGVPSETAGDGDGHLEKVDFAATNAGVDEATLKRVEHLLNALAAKLDCQPHASAPQSPGRRVPPGRRRHQH